MAYENMKKKHPESDMNMGGDREDPQIAHNSWRRMAATAAQARLQKKECSKEDIELHFGWKLKKHATTMRLHYAERRARASRSRMTELTYR